MRRGLERRDTCTKAWRNKRSIREQYNRRTAMEIDLGHSKMLVIIVIKYLFRQAQETGVNKITICRGC